MSLARLGLPSLRGQLPFVAAIVVDTLGTGLFLPVSLLYFTQVADLPLGVAGALVSGATAVSLPLPAVIGALVDRFGARRVVMAGQLLQGIGMLGYLGFRSPWPLFVAALLVAAGQRTFWSSFFALVADVADPAERDRWYGLTGGLQAAGIGVGALAVGGLLAIGGDGPFLAVVAVNAVTFFASALLLVGVSTRHAPVERANGSYRAVLSDRPFLGLTAANTVFALCNVFLGVAVPVYAVTVLHAPAWVVGPILALNTGLLAFGQTLVTRAVEGRRRTRAMALSGLLWTMWALLAAAALVLPRNVVVPYLFAITLCYAAAELVHAPTSNALAAAVATPEARGRYLASFQFSFAIAMTIAPAMFTSLLAVHGALPWLVLALLAVLAAGTMLALERRIPPAALRVSADAERPS